MEIILNLKVPPNFLKDIERYVLRDLSSKLNNAIVTISKSLKQVLDFFLRARIKQSAEYLSLASGKLKGELGVVRHDEVTENIMRAIVEASEVLVVPIIAKSKEIVGGLEFSVLRSNLEEVLGVPLSQFVSENSIEVPWLEWLLTRGNEIIILDYSFKGGPSLFSRTGLGIMVRGNGWRVPPEFAGTYEDNWLTRALEGVEVDIGNYIIGQLKFRLN